MNNFRLTRATFQPIRTGHCFAVRGGAGASTTTRPLIQKEAEELSQ